MKSKHTKGKCDFAHREFGNDGMYATEVFVGETVICQMDWAGEEYNENGRKGVISRRQDNAQLIADAFNVTNETGLTPRELQKSHAELLDALETVRLQVGQLKHNWDYKEKEYMPKVEQAIKNAKP
jgi:hypothetical protein